jgi:hypothetical protein
MTLSFHVRHDFVEALERGERSRIADPRQQCGHDADEQRAIVSDV